MRDTVTNNSCGVYTVYPLGVNCVTTDSSTGVNGSMEIFITGGTPPYTIEWSTGARDVTKILNVVPGTYTATVTDYYGDFTDIASCVVAGPPPALSPSPTPTPSATPSPTYPSTVCLTKNQESYDQYEFDYQGIINGKPSWSGSSFDIVYNTSQSRWDVSGFTPGYLVQNSNKNIPTGTWNQLGSSFTWLLNTGTCVTVGLNATVTKTDETCVGSNNGTVTVNAWGGVGLIVYSLDGVTYQSSATFTNLPSGNGTVYIKDSNNTVITRNFTVGSGSNATVYTLQLTTSTSTNSNAQLYKSKTVNWTASVTPALPNGVSVSGKIIITNFFTEYYTSTQNAIFTSGSTTSVSGAASIDATNESLSTSSGQRSCDGSYVNGWNNSGFTKTLDITISGGTVSGVDTFTVSNLLPRDSSCPVYGYNYYSVGVQNVTINGTSCGTATGSGGTNQDVSTSPFN